jgi:serine/threonine protein kinase/formylglycine-generating enzyme required for sulfatase activity
MSHDPRESRDVETDESSATRPLFSDGPTDDARNGDVPTPTPPPTGATGPTLVDPDADNPEAPPSPSMRTPTGSQSAAPDIAGDAGFDPRGEPIPGSIIFGRYLVEKELGRGGMGSVWLVRHLALDDQRALKLIVRGVAFDEQARARFRREGRVMARLKHANAVTVHDARMGHDVAFIEMECVRGKSLNRVLEPNTPMPLDWIGRILEQICDVLHAAHELGIVHRDLKPSNLMLVEGRPPGRELVKVLDFGIAKVLGADEGDFDDLRTRTGTVPYTPQYASPEQIAGAPVDARSDLYSLGVMLYEFLTGARPFIGPAVTYDHLSSAPPPFAVRNPDVRYPAALEALVMRCLAKRPDDRPASARALLEEFQSAVEGAETMRPAPRPVPLSDLPATPTAETRPFLSALTQRALPDTHPETLREAGAPPIPGALAHPRPGVSPAVMAAVASVLIVAAIGAFAFARNLWPFGGSKGNGPIPNGPPHANGKALEPPKITPKPLPESFAGYTVVPNTDALFGWPALIRHGESQVVYRLHESGVYLPDGYRPEGKERNGEGWPRVLVRENPPLMRFVLLDGGEFMMGAFDAADANAADVKRPDQPAHPVRVTAFYIQDTETTNAAARRYFDDERIKLEDRPKDWQNLWGYLTAGELKLPPDKADRYPAVGLPHHVAERCARHFGGRLPTEAEWEFAARSGGKPVRYPWGSAPAPSEANAHIDALSEHVPRPVDAYSDMLVLDRTEQGVAGMIGNVREWCLDEYAPYTKKGDAAVVDPVVRASSDSARFVVRGGSFRTPPEHATTTYREAATGTFETGPDLGFRIVLKCPPRLPPLPASSEAN